jgi:multiple sugar transport system substrate-binding protein
MAMVAAHVQAALIGKEDAKTALDAAAKEGNELLATGG